MLTRLMASGTWHRTLAALYALGVLLIFATAVVFFTTRPQAIPRAPVLFGGALMLLAFLLPRSEPGTDSKKVDGND